MSGTQAKKNTFSLVPSLGRRTQGVQLSNGDVVVLIPPLFFGEIEKIVTEGR